MRLFPSLLIALCLGCAAPASSSAEPTVPSADEPPAGAPAQPPVVPELWTSADPDGAVGLTGSHTWFLQREEPWGMYRRGADGAREPVVALEGHNIIGNPDFWDPIEGGYLAQWDVPTRIERTAEGGLRVDWLAEPGRWQDSRVYRGDSVWMGRYPDAVVRVSLADGSILQRIPIPAEAQGIELWGDETTLYASWTQYSDTAPRPTVTIPMRIRAWDIDTGEERWSLDFQEHPGCLTATRDTVLVAYGSDLHFIHAPSGTKQIVGTEGHPQIYPEVLPDGDRIFVALEDTFTSYQLNGRKNWQRSIPGQNGHALARAGQEVVVSTGWDSLMSFDVDSGEERWHVGIGLSPYGLRASEELLLAHAGSRSVGLPLPVRATPERAVIEGRASINCGATLGPIRVMGQEFPIDEDGRYEVTVEAAGIVTLYTGPVGIPQEDIGELRLIPGDVRGATVRLDGSGRYVASDITVKVCEEDE